MLYTYIKRTSFLIACFFMIFLGVFEAQAFSGAGAGTETDPYLVTTCTELQSIDTDASNSLTEDRFYRLANNIDCSDTINWNGGAGFDPIGDLVSFNGFEGIFDGAGFTISDIYINRPTQNEVGLFAYTTGSSIVGNVTLQNFDVTGLNSVGALAGLAEGVHIGISANGDVTGLAHVGGIFGRLRNTSQASSRLYFTGNVTGTGRSVGGILGDGTNGRLENVFVDAVVSGTDFVGGIVGEFSACCGLVTDSYALGSVTGNDNVGGIVGAIDNAGSVVIDSVFAANVVNGVTNVGAVIGRISNNYGAITASNLHFDESAAGVDECVGSTSVTVTCTPHNPDGLGADYFYSSANEPLASWDFVNVWGTRVGDYPILEPIDPLSGPGVVRDITTAQGSNLGVVVVDWLSPLNFGTFPLLNYTIQIRSNIGNWINPLVDEGTLDPSFTFGGLDASTGYAIRVRSNTIYGSSDWTEVSYTTGDPVIRGISTCLELENISTTGSQFDTYVLDNDIDCEGVSFDPINWGQDPFQGVLDGQGFTISNLTIETDASNGGLFESLNGASIQDLILQNGTINLLDGASVCGALAGNVFNTAITNIQVQNFNISCQNDVGGIFGRYELSSNNSTTFEEVSFNGSVNGQYGIGGLVGDLEIYSNASLDINQVFVLGNIQGTSDTIGGLFGEVYIENISDSESASTMTLRNAYNKANVTLDEEAEGDEAGGIAGSVDVGSDGQESPVTLTLENVYSAGAISGPSEIAGIFGDVFTLEGPWEQIEIINSFVTGSITAGNLDEVHIVVGDDNFIDGGNFILNGLYFDQTATGLSQALYEADYEGSFAINTDGTQANYFIANNTNPPLDEWDFENIWQTVANGLPVLRFAPEVVEQPEPRRRSSGTFQARILNVNTPSSSEVISQMPTQLPSTVFVFSRNLMLGMQGIDVKELQKFLNSQGFRIAESGPGSVGNETEIFGLRTQNALARFQQANGISPAVGYFGPITRNIVQARLGNVTQSSQQNDLQQNTPIIISTAFTRDLEFGDRGEDVQRLQEFLVRENKGPRAAALAAGGTSQYFGELTRAALIEWQQVNGIRPASGYFGPITRSQVLSSQN